MKPNFLMAVALMVMLAACGYIEQQDPAPDASANAEPITVRVSGYGTYTDPKDSIDPQKRLMAMRASRLDAYRALVERVYGTVIYGSSTVNEFAMRDDSFRTMIDSYIRGAKVLSVNETKNGTFETVVELVLEPSFRECLTNSNHFRYSPECRSLLRTPSDRASDMPARPDTQTLYYLDNMDSPESK